MYYDVVFSEFILSVCMEKKMVRGQKKSRDTNKEATVSGKSSRWDAVVDNYVAFKMSDKRHRKKPHISNMQSICTFYDIFAYIPRIKCM